MGSIARIDFPKPTATKAITRKEARMRYWVRRCSKCVRPGPETFLNVPLQFGPVIEDGEDSKEDIEKDSFVDEFRDDDDDSDCEVT